MIGVDLTPMVDLGFLLITFFVFTATVSAPTALRLQLPMQGDSSVVPESSTLNLVLQGGDSIRYFMGNDMGNLGCTDFSSHGVRDVIRNLQRQLAGRTGTHGSLVVLIYPQEQSSYKNIVDILDEMTISGVKKYILLDPPIDFWNAVSAQNKRC